MSAILVNWVKWCRSSPSCTDEIPSKFQTRAHNSLEKVQWRKRCIADSFVPQPKTHDMSVEGRAPCLARLSLVGMRLRRSRQTNRDTFGGIWLCQTSATWDLSTKSPVVVRKRYALLTVYPWQDLTATAKCSEHYPAKQC